MTIGERIKSTRDKKGISQIDLADACGIKKQTLYKYENGIITNIPSDKIELIAKKLGVSPAYLMGWQHELTEDHHFFSDDSVNSKILALMKHKGYSMRMMSILTHIPEDELHAFIYNTHNAEFSPENPLLLKIAEVLGVDINVFFDYYYFSSSTFGNYFAFLEKKQTGNVPLTDIENTFYTKYHYDTLDSCITESVLRKYLQIDHHGLELINLIIDKEYERCISGARVPNPEDDNDDYYDEPLHLRAVPEGLITWIRDQNLHPAIKMIKDRFPDADYAYQVPDDSMFPIYSKGDVVFIHAQDTIEHGEYGLFIVEEDCLLRKCGASALITENPDYDCIGGFIDIYVVGKVIATLKINKDLSDW